MAISNIRFGSGVTRAVGMDAAARIISTRFAAASSGAMWCCSCYYGVQESRYERDELSIPSDFKFKDRFTLFRDSEIAALICPRGLQVQAGSTDSVDHREGGKLLAPQSAAYYAGLSLSDRFQHLVFDGGHAFHDASAWEFVKQRLDD